MYRVHNIPFSSFFICFSPSLFCRVSKSDSFGSRSFTRIFIGIELLIGSSKSSSGFLVMYLFLFALTKISTFPIFSENLSNCSSVVNL